MTGRAATLRVVRRRVLLFGMTVPNACPGPSRGTGSWNQAANAPHQFSGNQRVCLSSMQGGRNAGKKNNRKYYSRLGYSLSLYGLDCPGNKIKTCLCVREVEMTLAILLPLERYDYLFATTGQQQEPDDRHMHREGVFILFQHYTEPANFLLREEALPFPSSVSLDAIARIAALGSVTVGLRAGHDNGENRGGSVGSYGRRVEGSEPFLHVSRRDIRDLVSPEPRQNLVAIVAPVDRECSGLPVAPVPAKDFLGDRLEKSSGKTGLPVLVATSIDRARSLASFRPVSEASPTTLQIHCPSCWVCMK